ncbi:MAG: hypothetical protein NVS3B20_04970 [Polyangiales bacterium]
MISLPLPDAVAWTHVKFWGIETLAGYRYGDTHHAVAAAFTFPMGSTRPTGPTEQGANRDAALDHCLDRFTAWGKKQAKAFDILIGEPRVDTVAWHAGGATVTAKILVLDVDRRGIFGNKRYRAAYAVYPAWSDACLVVGFAVPELESPELAGALRDRMVRDALPSVVARANAGSDALEAKCDVPD